MRPCPDTAWGQTDCEADEDQGQQEKERFTDTMNVNISVQQFSKSKSSGQYFDQLDISYTTPQGHECYHARV